MDYTRHINNLIYENPVFVLVYALVINALTLLLFGIDKRRAKKRKRRIPEAVLLSLTIMGGGLGALVGMYLFNHKTNHPSFLVVVPLSFAIYTLLLFLGVVGVI